MCNARNHSPDCTCGWGGLGHKGVRGKDAFDRMRSASGWDQVPLIDSRSYESHTIPNAKCPVCGEEVFYYWNEYGSSVFFDELGPPWPKHPCTDNTHRFNPKPIDNVSGIQRKIRWVSEGWILMIERAVKVVGNDLKISGVLQTTKSPVYLIVENYRKYCTDNIADVLGQNSSAFFRKINQKSELSVLSATAKHYLFQCKNITEKVLREQRNQVEKVQAEKEGKMTALELAFCQAKAK